MESHLYIIGYIGEIYRYTFNRANKLAICEYFDPIYYSVCEGIIAVDAERSPNADFVS